MLEVEIKEYLNNFKENLKNALLKYELFGVEEFDNLLNSLSLLTNQIDNDRELYLPLKEHIIDKYGLGQSVINLANNQYSSSQIAEVITIQSGVIISKDEINYWLQNYSVINGVRKTKIHGNLFDIQDRMQDIYMQVIDHLEVIKESDKEEFYSAKTTRQQVVLDTYKELRALTKDASSILQSISQQQQLNEFRKLVIESIKEVSPTTAQSIVQKLKQNKAIYTALLPN